MSRNVMLTIIVIAVVVLGGWFLIRSQQTPTSTSSVLTPTSTESSAPSASEGATAQEENIVEITPNGFLPQGITIKTGESVTWQSKDMVDHTVNSALHPTHLEYPPLNLGVIKPGESKSLTFPEAGTYKYHDHLNPSLFGSVTVQ